MHSIVEFFKHTDPVEKLALTGMAGFPLVALAVAFIPRLATLIVRALA